MTQKWVETAIATENPKNNGKIPTETWLSPQYMKQQVLKFALATYVTPQEGYTREIRVLWNKLTQNYRRVYRLDLILIYSLI